MTGVRVLLTTGPGVEWMQTLHLPDDDRPLDQRVEEEIRRMNVDRRAGDRPVRRNGDPQDLGILCDRCRYRPAARKCDCGCGRSFCHQCVAGE